MLKLSLNMCILEPTFITILISFVLGNLSSFWWLGLTLEVWGWLGRVAPQSTAAETLHPPQISNPPTHHPTHQTSHPFLPILYLIFKTVHIQTNYFELIKMGIEISSHFTEPRGCHFWSNLNWTVSTFCHKWFVQLSRYLS